MGGVSDNLREHWIRKLDSELDVVNELIAHEQNFGGVSGLTLREIAGMDECRKNAIRN